MSIADMNALPDISGNDSERLQEFVRVTAREVKTVGGASAGTTLDLIGYIRELEHVVTNTRAAVAGPRGDALLSAMWQALIRETCFNPATAKTVVFLGEDKFRKALAPFAATSSPTPAERERNKL